jgi:hypothetical protein
LCLVKIRYACWDIWKRRNKSYFQGIRYGDHTNAIVLACQLLNTWAKFSIVKLENFFNGASKIALLVHEIFGLWYCWNPLNRK